MEKEIDGKREGRMTYEKPILRIIELSAEEVLSVGCKSSSGGFSVASPPPCIAHTCAGPGS